MAKERRSGCQDVWNAYMVKGATWSKHDIPNCPTTATSAPRMLISYSKARTLCNKAKRQGAQNFRIDAYVHFYLDDQRFVGERKGIWSHPEEALDIIGHFSGMVTPDFSTYIDFPDPIKREATYKMRAFGYYVGKQGINVINNVRWGTSDSWEYCFDGISQNSIVAIGTVASGIRKVDYRPLFEEGFTHMIETLNPSTLVIYGSSQNERIKQLKDTGTNVLSFPSETNGAYKKAAHHE
jgi:hypothetical protein